MHQKNYKRRIEKFHGNKCEGGIVRSYSPIMTAYANLLETDDEVLKYSCNYEIVIAEGEYTSDFVVTLKNGNIRVRECCEAGCCYN